MFFLADSKLSHVYKDLKSKKVHGTFGLGWKYQEHTVWCARAWLTKNDIHNSRVFFCFIFFLISQNIFPYPIIFQDPITQCAPSIFNLDQKFQRLSCFCGIDIHETVQEQSRKTSVIRLPKFTTVNMARIWHQWASFSIENLIFVDYSFESLIT